MRLKTITKKSIISLLPFYLNEDIASIKYTINAKRPVSTVFSANAAKNGKRPAY